MRRTKAIITINVGLAIIMLAFNNCGQPGEIRFDHLPSTSAPVIDDNQNAGTPITDPGAGNITTPIPPVPKDPGMPNVSPMYAKVEKTITLAETLKADVLFVVDNSLSMAIEQANMSSRFPLFIKNLMSINWRVGVITTDIDDPDLATSDGRLQIFPNGQYYIDSTIAQKEADELFAKVIQRTESGSGYEQGIYATYRFLERDKASKVPFMRNDASINVVFVTDADETPYELSTGVPFFQPKNKPDELVKYLTSRWPLKKFQFHSIVVKENDLECLGKNGNESYGIEYEKLSTLTNGVKGSVCAEDYGSQLLFLSEKIKDLIKVIELDCEPALDTKTQKRLFSIKHESENTLPIEVEKFEGRKVYLKGSLPSGKIKLEYFCPTQMLSN